IDRQALPAPDDASVARRAYRAPEGVTEQAIADVWCELLSLERVGRDDHFFELGGHSLLALRVVGRLRDALSVDVSVRQLFEAPTIAGLARLLAGSQGLETGTGSEPIARADRSHGLPLSLPQQRLWFIDQLEGAGAAYHIADAFRL
ncbi:hypothetical protein JWH16_00300, partial [Xanthomonas campestris pv. campestris]|uniref:phosphopantetheine-binding protein n=1 Tax=Xanthomonas campestris TaxID=339 RepID=UPI001E64CA1D